MRSGENTRERRTEERDRNRKTIRERQTTETELIERENDRMGKRDRK